MLKAVHRFTVLALATASVGFALTGCEKVESETAVVNRDVEAKLKDNQAKLQAAAAAREHAEAIAAAAQASKDALAAKINLPTTQKGSIAFSGTVADADAALKESDTAMAAALKQLGDTQDDLKRTSDNPRVTPDVQAYVKALYGQSRYASGMAIIRQIEPQQARAWQLIYEIQRLVAHAAANKDLIEAFAAENPATPPKSAPDVKAPLDAITARQEQFKTAKKATEDEAVKVQAQIDDLQKQSDALVPQKTAAEAQMADLNKKADAEKADKAFALQKQSLDAREAAQNLGNQIEQLKEQIADLQRAKTALQNRAAMTDLSVGALSKQTEQLGAAWELVETEQKVVEKNSDATFGSKGAGSEVNVDPTTDPSGVTSVAQKSAELVALLKSIDTQREAALSFLNDADSAFAASTKAALTASVKYGQEFSKLKDPKSGEAASLTALKNLNKPEFYQLMRGRLFVTLGNIQASKANLAQAEAKLVHDIEAIDPKRVPEVLANDKADDTMKAAQEKAKASFEEVVKKEAKDADIPAVVQANDPVLTPVAQQEQVFAWYGLYTVSHDPADLTKASEQYTALIPSDVRSDRMDALVPEELRTGKPIAYRISDAAGLKDALTAVKATPPAASGGTPPAGGTPTTAATPGQDTPEVAQARAITAQFVAALARQDLPAAKELTQLPDDQAQVLEALSRFAVADKKLADAITAKFGADTLKQAGMDINSQVSVLPGKFAGDTVTFPDPQSPNDASKSISLKQDNGSWKLTSVAGLVPPIDKQADIIKALEESADEVNAGKYATFPEAKNAISAKLSPLMGPPATPAAPPAPATPAPTTPAPTTPAPDAAAPTTPAPPTPPAPPAPTTPAPPQ